MKNKMDYMGITLIEVMLALSLGMLLFGFLLELYLVTQHSMRQQQGLVDMQRNAQTVIDMLTREISQSGYIGCARLSADFPVLSHFRDTITLNNKLKGEANGEITIRHLGVSSILKNRVASGEDIIVIGKHISFTPGDNVMITDCQHVEITQVTRVTVKQQQQTLNLSSTLHYPFEADAEVGKLEINTFFLAKSHPPDSSSYSLMLRNSNGRVEEMLSGLNTLTFTYSVQDGDTWHELSATEVSDWSKVKGVAIEVETNGWKVAKKWHAYVKV